MTFKKGYTAKRWDRARGFQTLHKEKTGEKLPLKSFYKNDNAVTQETYSYEVTYAMDYTGEGYEFFIPQESFIVTGYGGNNSQDEIIQRVKEGVSNNFMGNSKEFVYNKTEVQIRGTEKTKSKYNDIDFNQLGNNNIYTTNVSSFQVGKGKSKQTANLNKYGLDVWL
jgi:predicted dithiol-disulfide oxidoreductase (DUF899 family)